MKEKKISFDYFWHDRYWYLIPTISFGNYLNVFDVLFSFLGFRFIISFGKKEWK